MQKNMSSEIHLKVSGAEKRLSRFYGDVARAQNGEIINLITGKKILDIGCGYGYLINQIMRETAATEICGIEIDPESIRIAKELFGIDVKNMSVYNLDFPDNYFDTVILRETIHHFVELNKLKNALCEISRVCGKELIILDPNPNWIVRLCRKLIGHLDPEAPRARVVEALEAAGFEVRSLSWRDVLAFPLSGGFIGKEFIPNIKFFKSMVISLDKAINTVLHRLKIQEYFCWRYLIYATKQAQGEKA